MRDNYLVAKLPLSDLPYLNAVQIGAVFVKATSVTAILSRSVRLVAHEYSFQGDSAFSQGGSCTLISLGGAAFVVTTRHQLNLPKGVSVSDDYVRHLRFTSADGDKLSNILVDRCFQEESNPDEEYHDILIFGVQSKWLSNSADRGVFFPIGPSWDGDRIATLCYGHPRSRNEFTYEPLHAFVRIAVTGGEFDEDFISNADYLRRLTYKTASYEVDGFSGGAVFSLVADAKRDLRVLLEGVIVRGGGGYLYIVDTGYLVRAIETFEK